jgi:hypothetical protein
MQPLLSLTDRYMACTVCGLFDCLTTGYGPDGVCWLLMVLGRTCWLCHLPACMPVSVLAWQA